MLMPTRVVGTFPIYHIGDSWAKSLYRPMYALDRQLRPDFWHAPDPTDPIDFPEW